MHLSLSIYFFRMVHNSLKNLHPCQVRSLASTETSGMPKSSRSDRLSPCCQTKLIPHCFHFNRHSLQDQCHRPDCQQEHNSCGGREYLSAALLGTVAPQNLVLLQVRGDVKVFTPLAAELFEVSDSSSSRLNHYSFSNAHEKIYRLMHPTNTLSIIKSCYFWQNLHNFSISVLRN